MKNTNIYKGAEKDKKFRIVLLGSKNSGKSTLLFKFAQSTDKFAREPRKAGIDEYDIELQTSSGVASCSFVDYNFPDLNISPQQTEAVCTADCLLVVTECLKSPVEQCVNAVKKLNFGQLIVLVGNKFDDWDPDQLNMQQMNGYAALLGGPAIQVSAKTGLNFDDLQFMVADLLMNPQQKYQQVVERQNVQMGKAGKTKDDKKSKCKGM